MVSFDTCWCRSPAELSVADLFFGHHQILPHQHGGQSQGGSGGKESEARVYDGPTLFNLYATVVAEKWTEAV